MTNTKSLPDPFPLTIIIAGCIIILLTFGPRSAMGLFQIPMLADTGWDRTTFGIAIAIQNLFWGFGQPFFGAIADKYGAGRVLVASSVLYSSGLFITAIAPEPVWLHIGAGLLMGLGISSGTFSVLLAIFARNVSAEKRSFAFGLATAFSSLSMLLFTPLSQGLIEKFGWSEALLWMSALMLIIPFFAIPLRGNGSNGIHSTDNINQSISAAMREAFGHKSYLLLASGFFVCGFQVAFITVHFPAYLSDIGIDATYAVLALALIGLFNIAGSLGSGILGQKYSKPKMLSFIYIARSVAVTLFLLIPQSPTTVIIFACVMGLLWLSTVAPTNALVAIMFGTKHMGLLGGIIFFSHQIGSVLGVALGGYLYDTFGTYNPVWWASVVLGIFAALVHLPIVEKPIVRAQSVPN
jgi:predicted MFS family arabinose efflux permease